MGVFHWIVQGLTEVLRVLYQITNSYGVGIILLTLAVRLLLYPLTISQVRAMAGMRELAPKLKELQEKYKDRPQEYQRRMMDLYKEHKVNPFGGCLPLLLQFPVFIALYYVFRDFPYGGAGFLWLSNLAKPDPYWVLPILNGVTMYFQMQSTSTGDASQKTMVLFMPIMMAWISVSLPSGLVLYWIVSNVFSWVQQIYMNRQFQLPKGGTGAK